MPVRNWSFAAYRPLEGEELLALRQMRLAAEYRNMLVNVELGRRAAEGRVVREFSAEVAALEAQEAERVAELDTAVSALRNANRTARGKVAGEGLRGGVAVAKAALRECRAALKAAKALSRANPAAAAARAAIEESARAAARDCRREMSRERGLYWGSYLAVEDSLKDIRKGAPPRRKPVLPEGKVSVHVQGKSLTWEQVLAGDHLMFRLEVMRRRSHPSHPPEEGSRRSRQKRDAIAWIRVGSSGPGNRTPVWTKVRVRLHRQPDPSSRIKWVHLFRRRHGTSYHWDLVISMDVPSTPVGTGTARVAVNPGWRLVEDGLRVATWAGDDGRHGCLVLPHALIGRWAHADSLQAIRDRNFDVARTSLLAFLASGNAPAWLVERLSTLTQWRSEARLARVVIEWRNALQCSDGFPPEEAAALADAEHWRSQDRHLAEWEANERRKAQAQRLGLYRNLAADLRQRYGTVVIGQAGCWSQLARSPSEESGDPVLAACRYNQRISSPYLLESVMAGSGMAVCRADRTLATQTCHVCGSVDDFDAERELVHTCSICANTWDQDHNHCRNLLARAEVVNETLEPARDS